MRKRERHTHTHAHAQTHAHTHAHAHALTHTHTRRVEDGKRHEKLAASHSISTHNAMLKHCTVKHSTCHHAPVHAMYHTTFHICHLAAAMRAMLLASASRAVRMAYIAIVR